jgi:hypothetical protein
MLSYSELPKTKIKKNRGLGVTFSDDKGNLWETVSSYDGAVVHLIITTFRGICIGAVHYYGSLTVVANNVKCVKSVDGYQAVGDVCNISGGFDRFKPKEALGLKIELKRSLSKTELSSIRFKDYKVFKKPKTSGFNSVEEVRAEAKKIFEKHFEKGWKIEEDLRV